MYLRFSSFSFNVDPKYKLLRQNGLKADRFSLCVLSFNSSYWFSVKTKCWLQLAPLFEKVGLTGKYCLKAGAGRDVQR